MKKICNTTPIGNSLCHRIKRQGGADQLHAMAGCDMAQEYSPHILVNALAPGFVTGAVIPVDGGFTAFAGV